MRSGSDGTLPASTRPGHPAGPGCFHRRHRFDRGGLFILASTGVASVVAIGAILLRRQLAGFHAASEGPLLEGGHAFSLNFDALAWSIGALLLGVVSFVMFLFYAFGRIDRSITPYHWLASFFLLPWLYLVASAVIGVVHSRFT